MFHLVAYNADHFSALRATTQKSALISFHVCFSALLLTTQIIFPHCRPQHGKIICVLDYIVEKWSALLATTRKNVRIRLFPRIQNHMRISTRVSIRGLGWRASWGKVEVKNLVGLSLQGLPEPLSHPSDPGFFLSFRLCLALSSCPSKSLFLEGTILKILKYVCWFWKLNQLVLFRQTLLLFYTFAHFNLDLITILFFLSLAKYFIIFSEISLTLSMLCVTAVPTPHGSCKIFFLKPHGNQATFRNHFAL